MTNCITIANPFSILNFNFRDVQIVRPFILYHHTKKIKWLNIFGQKWKTPSFDTYLSIIRKYEFFSSDSGLVCFLVIWYFVSLQKLKKSLNWLLSIAATVKWTGSNKAEKPYFVGPTVTWMKIRLITLGPTYIPFNNKDEQQSETFPTWYSNGFAFESKENNAQYNFMYIIQIYIIHRHFIWNFV